MNRLKIIFFYGLLDMSATADTSSIRMAACLHMHEELTRNATKLLMGGFMGKSMLLLEVSSTKAPKVQWEPTHKRRLMSLLSLLASTQPSDEEQDRFVSTLELRAFSSGNTPAQTFNDLWNHATQLDLSATITPVTVDLQRCPTPDLSEFVIWVSFEQVLQRMVDRVRQDTSVSQVAAVKEAGSFVRTVCCVEPSNLSVMCPWKLQVLDSTLDIKNPTTWNRFRDLASDTRQTFMAAAVGRRQVTARQEADALADVLCATEDGRGDGAGEGGCAGEGSLHGRSRSPAAARGP
jgi:hypothetical protein